MRMAAFLKTLPIFISFHDQTLCFPAPAQWQAHSGCLVCFYVYDLRRVGKKAAAARRDADYYRAAGLNLATNKLHWLLCGSRGGRSRDAFGITFQICRRQSASRIADTWFTVMFTRFKGNVRLTFDSDLTDDAEKVCERVQNATTQLTFEKILSDICGFLALSSQDLARAYFDFWSEMINRRQQALRKTGS